MLQKEFRGYGMFSLGKDLLAGITVAAVALPLALAFGVSSGATAAAGLITAILSGFVIGALSGGSYQITGPTGTKTVILFMIIAQHGLQGVFIACFMSGIIMILAGIFKIGNIVSFIPTPVIIGFTSGIALTIILGQIDGITGLVSSGGSATERLVSYFTESGQLNYTALLIGASVIVFMLLYPKKLSRFFPASLAAIILFTAFSSVFNFGISTVGDIPRSLFLKERLDFSVINFGMIKELFVPSLSIAALGMVESLLCGASAGRMKDEKLNADIELAAQGIGNMIIPLFGGVPASAAIARTSVAIKAGGATRLTGVFHACVLLLSMFVLAPVISSVPLAALSGVLIVTAVKMNEWKAIRSFFTKRFYTAVFQFLVTMLATVIFDLTAAIIIGVVFSAIMFVFHISDMQVSIAEVDETRLGSKKCACHDKTAVVYITGPLYFGTASRLADKLVLHPDKKHIVFSVRGMPFADMSGVDSFRDLLSRLREKGVAVYFASVQPKVMEMFCRCGITEDIGNENYFWSTDIALAEIANLQIPVNSTEKCCTSAE